jgi:hypothetical protein
MIEQFGQAIDEAIVYLCGDGEGLRLCLVAHHNGKPARAFAFSTVPYGMLHKPCPFEWLHMVAYRAGRDHKVVCYHLGLHRPADLPLQLPHE